MPAMGISVGVPVFPVLKPSRPVTSFRQAPSLAGGRNSVPCPSFGSSSYTPKDPSFYSAAGQSSKYADTLYGLHFTATAAHMLTLGRRTIPK